MSQDRIVGERLVLAVRTTRFSEFRSPEGALLLFEIASRCTSFGRLCTKLAQMPGVAFADASHPVKYSGPARFHYKGTEYEVSIPHTDYRVGPVDLGSAPANTDELLTYVKEHVAPRPAPVARQII
jgi:hypothetical protein